jgi:hypothetical protein
MDQQLGSGRMLWKIQRLRRKVGKICELVKKKRSQQ